MIGVVVLVILVAIGLYLMNPPSSKIASGNYDDFAKCLTQNKAKMYGASWCPHCQAQKKMFGSSFQYVDYVECAEGNGQAKACSDAGITGYPTWDFNGKRKSGELTVADLSDNSGCSLDLIKVQ